MSKKLKVLFLTTGKYPVPATEGGAVENLVEMMLQDSCRVGSNYQIAVISAYSERASEQAKQYCNISFFHIHQSRLERSIYDLIRRISKKLFATEPICLNPYFVKAKHVAKNGEYDCIIVENKPQFVNELRRSCKDRIVLHLHNDILNSITKESASVIMNTDCVITVSDYINKRVQEINFVNTPVITVRNVIDHNMFYRENSFQSRSRIRGLYGIALNDTLFVFVGRLIPDKGVDKLIEAFLQLKVDNVSLLIVGGDAYSDSVETEYVRSIYNAAKNSDHIHFTGYVPYKEIPSYYNAADAAVFPSICEEAAGLVSVEAQACGLPVVVANAGGMTEYVNSGSAIVVERGESMINELATAMERLAADGEIRRRMGVEALKCASGFCSDGYFEKIVEAATGVENADK